MDDPRQVHLLRSRLSVAVNKVPERIVNGSIQQTRHWVELRDRAVKILKKPNATETELRSALSSIE